MPHVRRFGFSGVFAVGVVVVMVFGINPITVLTGQVAEPLPYTPLTALADLETGKATPEDLVDAVSRETNGFWERGFRSAAAFYPPVSLSMVESSRELGCGLSGSSIGTFYCPQNSTIYVDMAAYADLVAAYPAQGHLAQTYLIGLAYGHHVQNAQDLFETVSAPGLSAEARVVLEQRMSAQAACYTGASTKWAGLDMLLDDAATANAIASGLAGGGDVTRVPSRAEMALPRDFAPAPAAFNKAWFDAGYAIPAIGTCRLEKIGLPD
jgi:uncharacterized protein